MNGWGEFIKGRNSMNKILIAGKRPEIGTLFELLLWQANRQFLHTKLSACLDMALRTKPNLIIVESQKENLKEVYSAVVSLKGSSVTDRTPIVLTLDEGMVDAGKEKFDDLVDDVIAEPFKPSEVKTLTEKYL